MLITKSSGHILRHQGNGAISSENGKKDRKSVKYTKGYKKKYTKILTTCPDYGFDVQMF